MDIEALCEQCSCTPLFREADASHVRPWAEGMQVTEYSEGDPIFQEGDPGDSLYVVLNGEVEIFKQSPEGREQVLAGIPQNSVFGEIAFLTGSPRSASARARGETKLASLRRGRLDELMDRGDPAAIHMILTLAKVLSSRLALMGDELVALSDKESGDGAPGPAEIAELRRRLLTEWNF